MKTIQFISRKTNKILKYIKRKKFVIRKIFKIIKLSRHEKYIINIDSLYLDIRYFGNIEYSQNDKCKNLKIFFNSNYQIFPKFINTFLKLTKIKNVDITSEFFSSRNTIDYIENLLKNIGHLDSIKIHDTPVSSNLSHHGLYDLLRFENFFEKYKIKRIIKENSGYFIHHYSKIFKVLKKNSKTCIIIIYCSCELSLRKLNFYKCYYDDVYDYVLQREKKDYIIQKKMIFKHNEQKIENHTSIERIAFYIILIIIITWKMIIFYYSNT